MKQMCWFFLFLVGFFSVTQMACQKDFNSPNSENTFSLNDCRIVRCEERSIVSAEIVARRGSVEENRELSDYFKHVFEDNPDYNTIIRDIETSTYLALLDIAPDDASCLKGFTPTEELRGDRCQVGKVIELPQPQNVRTNTLKIRVSITETYNGMSRFFGW